MLLPHLVMGWHALGAKPPASTSFGLEYILPWEEPGPIPHILQMLTSTTDGDQIRLQLSLVAKTKLYLKKKKNPATFKITSQFALLALLLIVDKLSCEVIVLCYFFLFLHKTNNTALHKPLQARKLTKIPSWRNMLSACWHSWTMAAKRRRNKKMNVENEAKILSLHKIF